MIKDNKSLSAIFRAACEDDAVIKHIFDNLRNIGIAALVLAGCEWYLSQRPVTLLSGAMAFLLGVAGTFLLFANLWYFTQKLKALPVPLWVKNFLAAIYGCVITGIFSFLASRH